LVVAASCWSLIDQRKAVGLYRRAAELYQQLSHSYWIPMKLASSTESEIRETSYEMDEEREPNPLALAFALIANTAQNRNAELVVAHWRHVGNVPIGRLVIVRSLNSVTIFL